MSALAPVRTIVVIVGSKSDLPLLKKAGLHTVLTTILGRDSWKLSVISAHRNAAGYGASENLSLFCRNMIEQGALGFIAAAGKSALLAGAVAAAIGFSRQVIGVALPSTEFPNSLDALLSMGNNPKGAPMLIASGLDGVSGLYNAAVSACHLVAVSDSVVNARLQEFLAIERAKKPAIFDFSDQDQAIEDSDKPKPPPGGC